MWILRWWELWVYHFQHSCLTQVWEAAQAADERAVRGRCEDGVAAARHRQQPPPDAGAGAEEQGAGVPEEDKQPAVEAGQGAVGEQAVRGREQAQQW